MVPLLFSILCFLRYASMATSTDLDDNSSDYEVDYNKDYIDLVLPERDGRLLGFPRLNLSNSFNPFPLKLFPFIIIRVPPNPCNTESGAAGTCYNYRDCEQKKGRGDGTCAQGFGVCCVFEKTCGGVVDTNVTYLVNDDYPSSFDDIGNCQYIINKVQEDICQLRIDMETLMLAKPNNLTICEEDTFTLVGTGGENPRVICGENSGQHMYIDMAGGTASARVNIATTSIGVERSWRLKVTQIACNSVYRAPPNCLQYFTEYAGNIKSFNYQKNSGSINQLANQRYTVCIKTKEGFCGINYKATDFSMTGNATGTSVAEGGDQSCTTDFVSTFVVDKNNEVNVDRFCGNSFNDTITYSKPFELRIVTDDTEESTDIDNQGFSINYVQVPC